MTSHAGTFNPAQGQPNGWAPQGWSQNTTWGWNSNAWNPNSAWAASGAWNPNTGWAQPSAWNPNTPWEPNAAYAPCPAPVHGIGCGSFAAEVAENTNEFILSIDVPGINAEDLEVSFTGNTFLINGVRKDSQEAGALAYSEVAKGNITRAIAVPFEVDPNKSINTSLENGVLKIRIAKESQTEKKTATRKVKI